MVAEGRLAPDTSVWREGLPSWVPASTAIAESKAVPPPPPAPARLAPQTPPQSPQRYVAPPPSKAVIPARPRSNRTPLWIALAIGGVLVAGVLGWAAGSRSEKSTARETAANEETRKPPALRPVEAPPRAAAPAAVAPVAAPATESAPSTSAQPIDPPPASSLSAPPIAESSAPASEPPAEPAPIIAPATEPAPTQTETIFQELRVRKSSRFDIEGLAVPQQAEYRILSSLAVGQPNDDGIRTVEQTVLDARLESADDATRATFTKGLADLREKKFVYKLDRNNEVVDFKGESKPLAAAPLAEAGGIEALGGLGALGGLAAGLGGGETTGAEGFLVATVMDDDGWQELAEYTFFQPGQEFGPRKPLRRQRTHDWGPLGAWSGETQFTWRGEKQGLLHIQFAHELKYEPPAGKSSGLPFEIASAEFAPPAGRGLIGYDQKRQRAVSVEEEFVARGAVAAHLLGQSVRVQIEEQQLMAIYLFDQNPWEH
jgi:hypothetical protein